LNFFDKYLPRKKLITPMTGVKKAMTNIICITIGIPMGFPMIIYVKNELKIDIKKPASV
jgi:hypothetical protein